MAYKSLQHFIEVLDQAGELVRITEQVNPELEITEITDRVSKQPGGGKALLFENTGTGFPVLINAYGSYSRMCMALGVNNLDNIGKELRDLFLQLTGPKDSFFEKLKLLPRLGQVSAWMPKAGSGKGKCQEVVHYQPDITKLPVLKCWPYDGGRFVTLPVVNTIDPETGIRNVGMYRMQVFNEKLTGMHWHKHKVGARHYEVYKKMGKKMPVAVTLGGDPAITYAATAPLPDNVDEYMLAGFLRKKRVELVKCITQDIEVPADADFVIEGYIDPQEGWIWEGPFGDHTGFYSLADWYPQFHITCITHRKNAVYPATIVGIPPQEDAYLAKATERIFLTPIQLTMLPEMQDMNMPEAGVAHNITIVKIKKSFPGHAAKIMNALWGAGQMMFNKLLVVVDGKVDIHDYDALSRHIAQHYQPGRDTLFSRGPLDVLDHASTKAAFGGKLCIDATAKLDEEKTIDYTEHAIPKTIDDKPVLNQFPEIKRINQSLLQKEIPVVFLAIEKKQQRHIQGIAENICRMPQFEAIKMLIFTDNAVDVRQLQTAAWLTAGNIDPSRDCFVIETTDNKRLTSHLVIDATSKSNLWDNFKRDWPNVLVSKDETIQHIDKIWHKLGMGDVISSPSLQFKALVRNQGAVAGKPDA